MLVRLIVFVAIFVHLGCEEEAAPIETPDEDRFVPTEPATDAGQDAASNELAKDSGPEQPGSVALADGGTLNPNLGTDGGPSAGQGTDAGAVEVTDPYVPCEGQWVYVNGDLLVPAPVENADAGLIENVVPLAEDGGAQIADGGAGAAALPGPYWSCDLLFLGAVRDNSGLPLTLLEVGAQTWTEGRLTGFYADDFGLSGTLPSRIGDVRQLKSLSLARNNLSGAIPTSITHLANLTLLSMPANRFEGAIPSGLGNLTQLINLDLSSNRLTGTIPSSIGQLTGLRFMLLSHNDLSGPIPATLSDLSELFTVELFQNELSGPIPSDLNRLTKLKYFSVSYNQLSGSLPAALSEMAVLDRLLVGDNRLEGVIAESLCDLDIDWDSANFSIRNNRFCPAYPSCIAELMGTQDTTDCPAQ